MPLIQDDALMGYLYISEATNPDISIVENIDRSSGKDGVFYVTFDTNLQDFDVMNRNQRYYSADNIWQCIQSDRIQSMLKANGWFGEFEHPIPIIQGQKLTPERLQNVIPENRAFKIMNPKIVGNVLKARIQSAQGSVGVGFGKEVLAGWIPQFSGRSIAHMVSKNGKPYVCVKKLITYDAPWYPSHAIAHATSSPVVTNRNASTFESVTTESTTDDISSVTVPLKEILEGITKTDVNVNMIMEAFDIDESDIIGFDNSKTHVIMRDENNMIYANINPNTVRKVKDFYDSFK